MAGSGDILERVWEYLGQEISKIHRELDSIQARLSGRMYHTRAVAYHSDSLPVSGPTPTIVIDSSAVDNHYATQGTGAIGNQFTTSINLESGTYTIKIYGIVDTNCGIMSWALDNILVAAEQDWYNASKAVSIKSFVVNVESDGVHKLTGTVTGKHDDSTNYALKLTKISAVPQVD